MCSPISLQHTGGFEVLRAQRLWIKSMQLKEEFEQSLVQIFMHTMCQTQYEEGWLQGFSPQCFTGALRETSTAKIDTAIVYVV
eukprot:2902257-Amphidinium_carterae.1